MPGVSAFPAFAEILPSVQEIWPWGEVASIEEVSSRLAGRWPTNLVEAAIWKVVADAAAAGHLLVDLEQHTLDRTLPLALLPPDAPPLAPPPLPDTLLPEPEVMERAVPLESGTPVPGPTFDASTLPDAQLEHFYRNWRAVEQVLAGAPQTKIAAESGIPRSTLGRLVRRSRELGQIACVPNGSYLKTVQAGPLARQRFALQAWDHYAWGAGPREPRKRPTLDGYIVLCQRPCQRSEESKLVTNTPPIPSRVRIVNGITPHPFL